MTHGSNSVYINGRSEDRIRQLFQSMRIPRFASAISLNPRRAIIAAAILHVLFTASVFSAGRLGLFPSQFNRDGIGEFARNSNEFREQANSLADIVTKGDLRSWVDNSATFHVRLYALDFVLMRPLIGTSILAAEPLNLFYYLAILMLTFSLTRVVAGRRAAWLAAALIGVWPSLLLHTTQFVRDPLLIASVLALVLLLTRLLKLEHQWRGAAIDAAIGILVCLVIWLSRRDMWLVIIATIVFAALLLIIRILRERKLFALNLAVIALLGGLVITVPRNRPNAKPIVAANWESVGVRRNPRPRAVWGIIGATRERFIYESRQNAASMIDAKVNFFSPTDVIKYIPRALEIGYLAPFPSMWFTSGYNVGLAGRLLSGVEMSVTYMIEALACVFIWRRRRRLDTWLLFLTTTIGVLALGMVVVNLGTLYRMRYPFWILIMIMGATVLSGWIDDRVRPQGRGHERS
jgi:hypothetical protein